MPHVSLRQSLEWRARERAIVDNPFIMRIIIISLAVAVVLWYVSSNVRVSKYAHASGSERIRFKIKSDIHETSAIG